MTLPGWMKERWFDFRNGHTIYGAMVLQFINFILLVKVAFSVPSPEIAMLLITTYGPVMVAVGYYYHRNHQLETDQNAAFRQSTLNARVWRVLYFGTEEEKESVRRLLEQIERGD